MVISDISQVIDFFLQLFGQGRSVVGL